MSKSRVAGDSSCSELLVGGDAVGDAFGVGGDAASDAPGTVEDAVGAAFDWGSGVRKEVELRLGARRCKSATLRTANACGLVFLVTRRKTARAPMVLTWSC